MWWGQAVGSTHAGTPPAGGVVDEVVVVRPCLFLHRSLRNVPVSLRCLKGVRAVCAEALRVGTQLTGPVTSRTRGGSLDFYVSCDETS